jgi:hypothetical protein
VNTVDINISGAADACFQQTDTFEIKTEIDRDREVLQCLKATHFTTRIFSAAIKIIVSCDVTSRSLIRSYYNSGRSYEMVLTFHQSVRRHRNPTDVNLQ